MTLRAPRRDQGLTWLIALLTTSSALSGCARNSPANGSGGGGASGQGGGIVPMTGGIVGFDAGKCPPAGGAAMAEPIAAGFGLRFRKDVEPSSTAVINSIAMARERLAIVADTRLLLFNEDGERTAQFSNPTGGLLSPPIGDDEGRFFVVGDSAVAIDRSGGVLWTMPVGRIDVHQAPPAPLLSSENILVVATSGGRLAGVKATTGELLWERQVAGVTRAAYGFGRAFAVSMSGDNGSVLVMEAASGSSLYELKAQKGNLALPYGVARGFGTFRGDPFGGGGVAVTVHDFDGKPRWALPAPSEVERRIEPLFVGLDGFLHVLDGRYGPAAGGAFDLRRFDCEGRESEPRRVVLGAGWEVPNQGLLGADGTLYVLAKKSGGTGFDGVGLFVFNPAGAEVFRHIVDGVGVSRFGRGSSMALTEGGLLYFMVTRPFSPTSPTPVAELLSFTTPSPGLARSGWSAPRHDKESRGWLRE